jgi:transposase
MEYFAGLDVSMEETHVCVVDRDGKVILEARTPTAPKTIAAALAKGPPVERVLFETGRMAPTLFHGLTALGMPVVCVESRQAYQALRSLAAHKTDRNDARGLAHLARTGFFKPVHVKSLPSHAVRALLVARKKLVGQRVTLENQIRGLAVAFGVRLPRGLSSGFSEKAMAAARPRWRNARIARRTRRHLEGDPCHQRRHEKPGAIIGGMPTPDDDSGCGAAYRTGLRCRDRRSRSLPTFA